MPDPIFKQIGSVIKTYVDATKADLEAQITSKTLPVASNTVLGGIKVGNGLWADGNGVLSTTITDWNSLGGKPTTLSGYGITSEVDSKIAASIPTWITLSSKPTTLAGFGLETEVDGKITASTPTWITLSSKPTTLAGFGLETEVDDKIAAAGSGGASDWDSLANKPTTLAGFGIEAEVNNKIATGAGLDMTRFLSMPGELSTFVGKARWYPPKNIALLSVRASVDTPPTGGAIQLVMRKNGVIVGNSIDINSGQNRSILVDFSGVTGGADDYFTVDVISVGSTIKGSDLTVVIAYEYN
jgi:hypothetical protein